MPTTTEVTDQEFMQSCKKRISGIIESARSRPTIENYNLLRSARYELENARFGGGRLVREDAKKYEDMLRAVRHLIEETEKLNIQNQNSWYLP